MSWEEAGGAILFFLTVSGALWAIWWRIDGRVGAAKDKADAVDKTLSDYKLHVAEHYATKTGVTEQMITLTKAVNDVGERMETRIDGMNQRLDRVIEANHKPTRRTS